MVKSRFAPSPTGELHIGGARTALFAWLIAKQSGGKFVIRIEDTDTTRSTESAITRILQSLDWLGIQSDEAISYQSARTDLYKRAVTFLLEKNLAYYCYATNDELNELRQQQRLKGVKPRYDGRYRDFASTPPHGIKPVIRFKNPLVGSVKFVDLVRGEIEIANEELDDLIIVRADGTPTYNFCAVVDDTAMHITHVIRGDDHINNTPRQINIGNALEGFHNYKQPKFAHLPMVLGLDGSRLSKRHGAASVLEYKELGFLPDALLNYLARLGWSSGDEEIFSIKQLIDKFSLAQISSSPARFDMDKLLWVNHRHIMTTSLESLTKQIKTFLKLPKNYDEATLEKAIDLVREKHRSLVAIANAIGYFFNEVNQFDTSAIAKHITSQTAMLLSELKANLNNLTQWNAILIKECIVNYAKSQDIKMGQLGMPLRIAVTGKDQSPSIDKVLELLGKEVVIERIETFLAKIKNLQ